MEIPTDIPLKIFDFKSGGTFQILPQANYVRVGHDAMELIAGGGIRIDSGQLPVDRTWQGPLYIMADTANTSIYFGYHLDIPVKQSGVKGWLARFLGCLLLCLIVGTPTFAQGFFQGNIASASQFVQLSVAGLGSVSFTVSGTWTATLVAQVSGNRGITWTQVNIYNPLTLTEAASTAANGLFYVGRLDGITDVRIIPTAYTSGNIVVALSGVTRGTGIPHIVCDSGCGSAASFADNSAFTAGTTPIYISGGWFAAAPTACTNGRACAPSMTSDRKMFVQDFQGTSPWVVSASGTFGVTQSTSPWIVSCSAAANCPVNATQVTSPWVTGVTQWGGGVLGAMANYGTSPGAVLVPGVNAFVTNTVTVTGTVTANQGTSPWVVSCTAANCAVNMSQWASTALGGPTAFGSTPGAVTVGQVNASLFIGTATPTNGGAAGSLGVGGISANNTAITQNPVLTACEAIAQGSQPTAATAGRQRQDLCTTEGARFVQLGSSNRFSCFVEAVTVTTQCQAAPAAGLRAYVVTFAASNEAITAQTLDIVFGTGANCVTGITALTHKFQTGTIATTTSPFEVQAQFSSPLIPTAANAICVRPGAATAFGATITGYIAP